MDNASYHNALSKKSPNSNSKKEVMPSWLTGKNISFDQSMKKMSCMI